MLLLLLFAGYLYLDSRAITPNTIRWVTQTEEDSFGYDVFRGPTEQGPFTRITPLPIASAGSTDIPQRYHFVDQGIEADTVYWYYVESISLTGRRERVTPVYASKPKSISWF